MAAGQYLLAIDQGTTGTTVLVIDVTKPAMPKIIGRATSDFPQLYPQPGWVEHDLDEIWRSVETSVSAALKAAESAAAGFSKDAIKAIGITNQRETLCTFERDTGKPVAKAIVWQCRRSAALCEELKAATKEPAFRALTGLILDPYFSGTKMLWLMRHDPTVASLVKNKKAVWGTIDTYLLNRLTGGAAFVTEPSNASRTLAFDIHKGDFSYDLLNALEIPHRTSLPDVQDSASLFGKTKGLKFLPDGIPITGVLGDQQAALAGQTCFSPGEAKCTYGTGAFLLLNTGDVAKSSSAGLLTTIAWSLNGKRTYALEGSSFIAGAAVQFLRDQLKIIPNAAATEAMAENVIAAPEVYFVPALAGLGCPDWDPYARGAFFGLTRGTTQEILVRATLEGLALQVQDLLAAMSIDTGAPLKVLRVDGGAVANNLLMQIQANVADVPVDRPTHLETTALGAALFAGLGVGIYNNLNELASARKTERLFSPTQGQEAQAKRDGVLKGWRRAIEAVKVFAHHAP